MIEIQIQDKIFKKFISNKKINSKINELVVKLKKFYRHKSPIFLIVLDGASVFGLKIFKKCKIKNSEIKFIKLKSYEGLKSTKEIKMITKLNEDIKNRNIIIVEDIVDSGFTINYIIKILKKENIKSTEIVSLLYKPDNYNYNYNIKWYGFKIPNNFVVGYGLDYNGSGRKLNDIYNLIEKT